MTDRSICDDLFESAERNPERAAVITEGGKYTYRQFVKRVDLLSEALSRAGLKRGDRVVILLRDKLDCLESMYAVMAAGGIAVPCAENAAKRTLRLLIEDCGPRLLITSTIDRERHPFLIGASKRKDDTVSRLGLECHDTMMFQDSMMKNSQALERQREVDAAMILYTSGMNGSSKGVILTHRGLLSATRNTLEFAGIGRAMRELVGVSPAHFFGFGRICTVFRSGGTVVFTKNSESPAMMVKDILRYSCDALSSTSTPLARVLGCSGNLLEQVSTALRHIDIAGSHMLVDHKVRLLKLFPEARIILHYGLTEAPNATSIECHSESSHIDTMGHPSPHTNLAILSGNPRGSARGEIGEIALKGDHLAAGYWGDEQLTASRFTADGWFKTGDYGHLDTDGYLHLLGRYDDVIVMGEESIAPLEIENCIQNVYPDLEPCVVGIPDPAGILGQIPALCYVSRSGSEISPMEIMEAFVDRVDEDKSPRLVCSLDEFPRTQDGKIVRREVERMLRQMTKQRTLRALMVLDATFGSRKEALLITPEESWS